MILPYNRITSSLPINGSLCESVCNVKSTQCTYTLLFMYPGKDFHFAGLFFKLFPFDINDADTMKGFIDSSSKKRGMILFSTCSAVPGVVM